MALDFSTFGVTGSGDVVIYAALAFFAGLVGVVVYNRIHFLVKSRKYRADESVVDAVVLEYSRRLREYDRVIADMRMKIDLMDLRTQANKGDLAVQQPQNTSDVTQISHTSRASQAQHHARDVIEAPEITQHPASRSFAAAPPAVTADVQGQHESQNGTMDYILKMLSERPRTSREVQEAVGRSREHTARLMKKLHDSGLVARDADTKPFKYIVTDSGRERLQKKLALASEMRSRS